MAQFVIIGAGLTGLSTAYHLEQSGITDYALFEKESRPGGLCRSIKRDGFIFDYTGHLLHSNNDDFSALLNLFFTDNILTHHARNAAIFSHEQLTRYPYQQHLHGLPSSVIADCIEGFVARTTTQQTENYKDWVLHHFGSGFAQHFFFPYQQKIFDYPLEDITATWTGRFVPNTTLRQIICGALEEPKPSDVGYNAHFLYPQASGIEELITAFTRRLRRPPITDQTVQSIDTTSKRVIFANGTSEPYETLISTMPLNLLLKNIQGTDATNFNDAADKLHCNSVINLNLGVTAELPDRHWIYYPESTYPFYRIGFPHKLSHTMAPADHQSLSIEIASYNRSPQKQEHLIEQALISVKKLFGLTEEQIVSHQLAYLPHAYVIYDTWRDKNLAPLLAALEEKSIFSVGRYGSWNYSSMQEAVLAGKQLAHTLSTTPVLEQALSSYNKSVQQ